MSKKIKDIEISRQLEIPISTIQDWKNSDKKGWRYKLYLRLRSPEGAVVVPGGTDVDPS